MLIAKLFMNGRSQAVRLPRECRFEGIEVYVKKYGDVVMLIPKDSVWKSMVESLDAFTDDFMVEREQPSEQTREDIS